MKRLLVAVMCVAGGLVPLASGGAAVAATYPTAWTLKSSTADVDGDGRADRVYLRQGSADSCTVRVRTAAGADVRKTVYTEGARCRWHGAASFDPARGKELFVLMSTGPHSQWYVALTWRGGYLVQESDPSTATHYLKGFWVVDSALSVSQGVAKVNTSGGIRMVETAMTSSDFKQYYGTKKVYSWKDGRWSLVRTDPISRNSAHAYELAGWHVPGLPVWAA